MAQVELPWAAIHLGRFWISAQRQPLRRSSVGVKVVLAEGESLPVAIRRLRMRVSHSLPRLFARRQPYYMKPSEKRRYKKYDGKLRKRMMAQHQSDAHFGRPPTGSRFRSRLKITKLLLLK